MNMKAEYLMIGNYVYSPIDGENIQIISSDIYLIEKENYREAQFERIYLTDEWLVQFGFIWNEAWGCFIKNGYFVEKIGDLLLDRKYGKVIKYVDTLQNLYKIITDKELKLNK